MVFTSCFEDKDNWYTETSTLDGRYVVATTCEEDADNNTSITDGVEAMIYNSAANVKDEIWIEMNLFGEPVKSKFKITGDASGFKGVDTQLENVNEIYYIDTDYGFAPFRDEYKSYFRVPTSAGLINEGVMLYPRVTLIEGKVIPKGATTIGGNVSDSIYVKVAAYSDYVTFISYELSADKWEKPDVPEYGWKIKEGSNVPTNGDTDWDHTWTLSGYRYTGYPEDR